jgi:hypothetical protein
LLELTQRLFLRQALPLKRSPVLDESGVGHTPRVPQGRKQTDS